MCEEYLREYQVTCVIRTKKLKTENEIAFILQYNMLMNLVNSKVLSFLQTDTLCPPKS